MFFEHYQWLMVALHSLLLLPDRIILRSTLRKKARARLQGNS